MAQFPLALAVEPRLLPLAVANGFVMDNKVISLLSLQLVQCSCVFPLDSIEILSFVKCSNGQSLSHQGARTRMRTTLSLMSESYAVLIPRKLSYAFTQRTDRNLIFACRMFLSRTVAAEICMEATTNDTAYAALKKLDKNGELRFELSCVIAFVFIVPIRIKTDGWAVIE